MRAIHRQFLPCPSRATGLRRPTLLQALTFRLAHSSTGFALGLDSPVRLAGLRISVVDLVEMTLEFVLASKAGLVVFAAKNWAFEVLRFDAMLGRGVALEVGQAFSDEFAAGLTASETSRPAVVNIFELLMVKKPFQVVPRRALEIFGAGCPLTTRNAAAKCP